MTPREQAMLLAGTPPAVRDELQRLRYENARQREILSLPPLLQPVAIKALATEDAELAIQLQRAEWRDRRGFSERAARLRAYWARVDEDRFARIGADMRPSQRRGAVRVLRDGTDPEPRAPFRATRPPASLPPAFSGSFPAFPYVTRKDEIQDERTRYAEPATPRDPFEGDITTAWQVLCWFYESYKRRSAALGAPVTGGYADCARELGIPDPAWVRSTVLLRNGFADELIERMRADAARFPAWFAANLVDNRDRYRAERRRARGPGEGRRSGGTAGRKLTRAQVLDLVSDVRANPTRSYTAIGRKYDVTSWHVGDIMSGRRWSSLTGIAPLEHRVSP